MSDSTSAGRSGDGSRVRATDALDALCEEYWHTVCRIKPFQASHLGYHDFDELVPDLGARAQAAQAEALRGIARRARELDGGVLAHDEQVTAAMLAAEASGHADEIDEAAVEYTATPAVTGPLVELFETCPQLTLATGAQAAALVVRYRRSRTVFDEAARRLVGAARRERTPPAHTVQATIDWLDAYLASDLAGDPLLQPAPPASWTPSRSEAWREALGFAVESSLRPALQRYRDVLAHEVLPRARPPERPGLCWIPGGDGVYATAVRRHTTRELDPDDLHRTGRAEIERLAEEYRALARGALGTEDLPEIYRRLRGDPSLRFTTGEEVHAAAQGALARAEAEAPRWFGRLSRTICVVRPMEAHEAEYGTIACYHPPARDGARSGTYFVNTHAPRTRTRFEAEALAFHEAVPGHHVQMALAQELDLPAFRRHAVVNVYVEGWALYAERLADEMGLYSSDLTRLGMLAFDSWRAGRLVVDTGLHHLGWSRDRAIRYLLDNSPLAENNIVNEVDRYIVWPAQALGYKVGQREIVSLRSRAEQALGARFDLGAFHDALLAQGAVSLDMLGDLVEGWVAERARAGASGPSSTGA